MYKSTVFILPVLALLGLGIGMVGCPVQELPGTFAVAITAAERVAAARASGPEDAANSSWAVFRKADPESKAESGPYGGLLNGGILERPPVDGQIFIADFGENAQVTNVHESKYLLPAIYGEEIEVGGEWAQSTIPFLRFKSASYGVQVDNRYGAAVLVHVRFGPIYVGRAIIYNWGTINGDRLDGTFGYLLDFTGGAADLLLDSAGDQYPFYGTRLP